jgi:Protein of unknown function (DUF2584)
MGMPCQVNSIVKLQVGKDYPTELICDREYQVSKSGYRIFPMDVPLALVDQDWIAHADVIITQLRWQGQMTYFTLRIHRIYDRPWDLKH